ncbi:DoxX family protein [Corynebacterium uberis]|uniref:DoxX family protein n=1 Tax=Corynebacterium uberis TaxID=2883169 RepID=UPI001D0B61E9|nr:DoxX family protein [Corynebacterium uberis]UDL74435.1 DoxX family protein [Corynebacterium uberis]UDL76730.1 DoxX family protein [Corynebacterium uberis]UDL78943.1 DoxX family protein [Corynebacterium uberis]UDL81221.1 DoxX family protein [Corynebacterium uberis]UDL83358.1 DoxX family protein [Corynebacterium uberis]
MNDSHRIDRPDRAVAGADDLDVPTYSAATDSIYRRAGRAAPRAIVPGQAATAAEASATFAAADLPKEPDTPTSAGQAAVQDPAPTYLPEDHSAPLASDAPTRAWEAPTDFTTDFAADVTTDVTAAGTTAAPAAAEPLTESEPAPVAAAEPAGRGTTDLGLLIVRLVAGLWLVIHSLAVFFQLGHTPGIVQMEQDFAAASYSYPAALAIAVPSAQLAAGVFLVLGLITPLFAAVATVVTGWGAVHAIAAAGVGLNVFDYTEAVWLPIVLFGASVALQFTGPGLYSFDFSRSWARRPLASAWVFVVLGIAGFVAAWVFGAGVNPLH